MSEMEKTRSSNRAPAIHARSASMPSELPDNIELHSEQQAESPSAEGMKQVKNDPDLSHKADKIHPITIYSPQLGRQFTLVTNVNNRVACVSQHGWTPPEATYRGVPARKLFTGAKHNSCTNSPLAHPKLNLPKTECHCGSVEQSSNRGGPRLFWYSPRSSEQCSNVNHVPSSPGGTRCLKPNAPGHRMQIEQLWNASLNPDTTARTTNNSSSGPITTSPQTSARNMFFQRFRWKRSQRGTRSTSNSADGSPISPNTGSLSRSTAVSPTLELSGARNPDISVSDDYIKRNKG